MEMEFHLDAKFGNANYTVCVSCKNVLTSKRFLRNEDSYKLIIKHNSLISNLLRKGILKRAYFPFIKFHITY